MNRSPILILIVVLLMFACSRTGPRTMQRTESIMGTEVTVTVVAKSSAEADSALEAAMTEIRRFDQMMSLYKDSSEITKVNLAAGKQPVPVSPEMIEVVENGARVSRLTNGAFDVTIGPLVVLWQMRLKEGRTPTDKEILNVLPRVNYRTIVIDKKASTLFLTKPNMIMDFGGIAKGYAADKAAELLRKRGIENAVVAIAGDIRVLGRRQDGSPWRIGVQHPREKEKLLTVLDLSDKYISTSGDYERFKIIGKKRYHHILDPRTGKPSKGMASVTLICDRGSIGDPLTTALFIVGADKGMKIVKALGYEAIFEDDRGTVVMTEGVKTAEDHPAR